jgi:MoxR-like ATPase
VDPIHTTIRRELDGLKGVDWPLSPILVVITTNEERDLPDAFLRRCIVHEIPEPDAVQLTKIATAHFGPEKADFFGKVADRLVALREQAARSGIRAPSTAEYLDAIRTSMQLDIELDSETWAEIERLTLCKPRTLSDAEP